jgi:hypothetical protein
MMSSGGGEETSKDQTAAEAATGAASASPEACPQPPYDEDFNPFSGKGQTCDLYSYAGLQLVQEMGWLAHGFSPRLAKAKRMPVCCTAGTAGVVL